MPSTVIRAFVRSDDWSVGYTDEETGQRGVCPVFPPNHQTKNPSDSESPVMNCLNVINNE